MARITRSLALMFAGGVLIAATSHAEPVNCHKQIVKNLLKYKKTYLKKVGKCVDNENLGTINGPCPDLGTATKLQELQQKIVVKIAASCPEPDRTTIGYPGNCAFESSTGGAEGTCAALPVGNASELATCLLCWKQAELTEFLAILYASHASELCGGALDETSSLCSGLDCAMPLPAQHDLGDTGEGDCQKAIGKSGIKHLVSIEKVLEKCALLGSDRTTCLNDAVVQESLSKSVLKLQTVVKNKCGNNRDPIPNPPFCCRTGMGNSCTVAADRTDCEMNLGGTVQEGKTCNAGTCSPVGGGNQRITWWSTCPENACDGTLDTLNELISCVDTTAEDVAQELLCIQFPTGWPCPADTDSPSPAFVE